MLLCAHSEKTWRHWSRGKFVIFEIREGGIGWQCSVIGVFIFVSGDECVVSTGRPYTALALMSCCLWHWYWSGCCVDASSTRWGGRKSWSLYLTCCWLSWGNPIVADLSMWRVVIIGRHCWKLKRHLKFSLIKTKKFDMRKIKHTCRPKVVPWPFWPARLQPEGRRRTKAKDSRHLIRQSPAVVLIRTSL